jgi:hypothetical protein
MTRAACWNSPPVSDTNSTFSTLAALSHHTQPATASALRHSLHFGVIVPLTQNYLFAEQAETETKFDIPLPMPVFNKDLRSNPAGGKNLHPLACWSTPASQQFRDGT